MMLRHKRSLVGDEEDDEGEDNEANEYDEDDADEEDEVEDEDKDEGEDNEAIGGYFNCFTLQIFAIIINIIHK